MRDECYFVAQIICIFLFAVHRENLTNDFLFTLLCIGQQIFLNLPHKVSSFMV